MALRSLAGWRSTSGWASTGSEEHPCRSSGPRRSLSLPGVLPEHLSGVDRVVDGSLRLLQFRDGLAQVFLEALVVAQPVRRSGVVLVPLAQGRSAGPASSRQLRHRRLLGAWLDAYLGGSSPPPMGQSRATLEQPKRARTRDQRHLRSFSGRRRPSTSPGRVVVHRSSGLRLRSGEVGEDRPRGHLLHPIRHRQVVCNEVEVRAQRVFYRTPRNTASRAAAEGLGNDATMLSRRSRQLSPSCRQTR